MAHIIINPSLSAAIGYNLFLNPPKFAVVIAILEPANSTRTDKLFVLDVCAIIMLWPQVLPGSNLCLGYFPLFAAVGCRMMFHGNSACSVQLPYC